MEKLKMHSPDMTQENIARIRGLFPNCVTEAYDDNGEITLRVDFDLLRQELFRFACGRPAGTLSPGLAG